MSRNFDGADSSISVAEPLINSMTWCRTLTAEEISTLSTKWTPVTTASPIKTWPLPTKE